MTLKALDYHFNRVEVPLAPINKVCDMARPSASSDDQNKLILSSFPGRRKGQQDQETVGYLFWTVLLFNACHLPPEKPSPA